MDATTATEPAAATQANGGAGQRIYKFATADGTVYYRHRYYVNDRAPGFVIDL